MPCTSYLDAFFQYCLPKEVVGNSLPITSLLCLSQNIFLRREQRNPNDQLGILLGLARMEGRQTGMAQLVGCRRVRVTRRKGSLPLAVWSQT